MGEVKEASKELRLGSFVWDECWGILGRNRVDAAII